MCRIVVRNPKQVNGNIFVLKKGVDIPILGSS